MKEIFLMRCIKYDDFIKFYNKIYLNELKNNMESKINEFERHIMQQEYDELMKSAWETLLETEGAFYTKYGFIDVEYRKNAVKNKFVRVKGTKGRPKKDCDESFNNTINFKVNDAQYSKLKNFCVANNVNISDALRALVETL
jgi:Tfp pilus assembly protein PilE